MTAAPDFARPWRAAPRPDLPFLRRRTRRDPTVTSAPPPSSATPAVPVEDKPANNVRPARPITRMGCAERLVFTAMAPSVTLNRIQSAVGSLTIEMDRLPGEELTLGCVFAFVDGNVAAVHAGAGNPRPAPGPHPFAQALPSRLAVVLDLRQIRALTRAVFYGYRAPRRPSPPPNGLLTVRTFGGAEAALPFAWPTPDSVIALLACYNLGGELVVRTELDTFSGGAREVHQAYGFTSV